MSSNCPISVIIPFYNSEDTIIIAVESVLRQSLPPAELILMNDGSTDQSLEVLTAFLEKNDFPHTNVVIENYKENKGVYTARNHALEICSQPLVAFQDADDFWHVDKLKVQYKFFADDPDLYFVCSSVGLYEQDPKDRWDEELPEIKATKISKQRVLWRNFLTTSAVVIRKKDEFKFDNRRRRASDMGLWLEIILSGHKSLFTKEPLAFARKPLYGAGGLTKNIKKLEIAHQQNLVNIHRKGFISQPYLYILRLWSHMKYLRRLMIVSYRDSKAFFFNL